MRFTGLPTPFEIGDPHTTVVAGPDDVLPCRRCLRDGVAGETMVLTGYDPWSVDSPYRQPGPVYVHAHDCERAVLEHLPDQHRPRRLSVRGFDADGMATRAHLVDGVEVEERLDRLLTDGRTAFVHLHHAAPGCFAMRVDR